MTLSNIESYEVDGGAIRFSSSLVNSLARALKTIYDIGYTFGSSLRRTFSKRYC